MSDASAPTTSDPLRMTPAEMAAYDVRLASPEIEALILAFDDAVTWVQVYAWAGKMIALVRELHRAQRSRPRR